MRKLLLVMVAGLVVFGNSPLFAQNFVVTEEEEINQVLNMFSTLSAGGLFHTAKLHKLGGFDVGVQGVALFTPEEYKDLQQGPFEDVNFIGLPYLNGSVGLPFNLEATGRFFYFPLGEEPTDGGVTIMGAGLKYGILQKPMLPRLMVMANYTAFFVPEEYSFGTVNTISLKGVVSYKLAFLTIYGGAGIDRTSLKLDYEIAPGVNLTGDFKSDNVHGNLGVSINPLPMLYVNADYMMAEDFSGFNIGVGLSFR